MFDNCTLIRLGAESNVYVCLGGVVAYSIPEEPSGELSPDLTDVAYDGWTKEGRLIGGLGRLVDGEVGGDNFKLDIGYGKGNSPSIYRYIFIFLLFVLENSNFNFHLLIFFFYIFKFYDEYRPVHLGNWNK